MQLEYDSQNWTAKEYYYRTHYGPRARSASGYSASSSVPYVPSLTVSSSDSYAPLPAYAPSGGLETHIDAIMQDLTAPPQNDPINAFFTAKQAFLGKSVQDIVGLIYERETIKYESFHAMDYQAARIKTKLFELQNMRTGLNPQMERITQNIEKELNVLESEKRREEVECWRDVMRLKGDLREVMGEFGQEKRKTALLGYTPG